MAFFTKLTSFFAAFNLFIGVILSGGLPIASTPKNPDVHDDTIMFVSDFQNSISDLSGADRTEKFDAILNAAKSETPGLVVGGGDYQSMFAGSVGSAFGINQLRNTVAGMWDYNMQYLFSQGNHDAPKSACINDTGLYEFDKYFVYIINEDDFPWNEQLDIGIKEKTVKNTADLLSASLSELASSGENRPVFVVSHLPLHFSSRSGGNDNRYAKLIFEAISSSADKLNIVYLYGHNHSDTYDDYIGGAVNYIAKGCKIKIAGYDVEKILNFTYTNCGYIGYSNNSATDTSSDALSATFITVTENGLNIRKYSKDGVIMQNTVPAVKLLSKAS